MCASSEGKVAPPTDTASRVQTYIQTTIRRPRGFIFEIARDAPAREVLMREVGAIGGLRMSIPREVLMFSTKHSFGG